MGQWCGWSIFRVAWTKNIWGHRAWQRDSATIQRMDVLTLGKIWWWFHRAVGLCPSAGKLPLNISRFLRIRFKNLSRNWSHAGGWVGQQDTDANAAQKLLRDSCRGSSTTFWNGHPSAQMWISLKICGTIWSSLSVLGSHQAWLNWRCFVRRNSPK